MYRYDPALGYQLVWVQDADVQAPDMQSDARPNMQPDVQQGKRT
jgi:hypothetical protein